MAVLLLLLLTSAGQEGTRTPDLPFPARARVGALRLPMPLAVTVTGPVWTDEVAGGKRRAGEGGSGRAGGQQGNRATRTLVQAGYDFEAIEKARSDTLLLPLSSATPLPRRLSDTACRRTEPTRLCQTL